MPWVIVAVTLISIEGIAIIAAAAASLPVQLASATNDVMNTTTSIGGGGEQGTQRQHHTFLACHSRTDPPMASTCLHVT
jgi:hypothetical protein